MAINVLTNDMSGLKQELSKHEGRQVIVDFWASWCGPCKALTPVLEEIDAEDENVVLLKVNVDDNSALASEIHVQSIPTLLFFKNGAPNAQPVIGVAPKEVIVERYAS